MSFPWSRASGGLSITYSFSLPISHIISLEDVLSVVPSLPFLVSWIIITRVVPRYLVAFCIVPRCIKVAWYVHCELYYYENCPELKDCQIEGFLIVPLYQL